MSSDEVVSGEVGRGYRRPFQPLGSEGLAVVEKCGRDSTAPPPGGHFHGEIVREDIALSPRTSPPRTYGVGAKVGEPCVGVGVVGEVGVHDGVGLTIGGIEYGPAWGLG